MNLSTKTKILCDVNAITSANPDLIPYLSKVRAYRATLHPALLEAIQTMLVDFLMIHIELPMPITTGKLRTIRAVEILKDIDATEDDRKEIADLVLALWLRSEDQRKGTSMDGAAGPRIINWLKRRLGWQSDRPQPRIHPMAAQVTSNAPAA